MDDVSLIAWPRIRREAREKYVIDPSKRPAAVFRSDLVCPASNTMEASLHHRVFFSHGLALLAQAATLLYTRVQPLFFGDIERAQYPFRSNNGIALDPVTFIFSFRPFFFLQRDENGGFTYRRITEDPWGRLVVHATRSFPCWRLVSTHHPPFITHARAINNFGLPVGTQSVACSHVKQQ